MPENTKADEDAEKKEEVTLNLNPNLPTVFADRLHFLMREDGFAVLRWIQVLPEFSAEVARVMVTENHLKRIIDLLCKNIGHYPTPDEDKEAG